MFDIDFVWRRDAKGYEIVPAPVIDPKTLAFQYRLPDGRELEMTSPPPDDRIVWRGGKLIAYRPLQEVSGLWRLFARSARTKDGLLNFVDRFGMLTQDDHREFSGRKRGEDVRDNLAAAAEMNEISKLSPERRAVYLAGYGHEGMQCGEAIVSIVLNPASQMPQMKLQPQSLLQALWLEFAQDMSSGHSVRECLYCGTLFETGPGSRRRADAKFCSDDHRIAFNSSKRKKGAG